MSRFTCKLLLAVASPDEVVKMGEINKAAALSFVKSFPFRRELARRKQDPSLTAPTITFHDNAAHRYLSIRGDSPGHFAVWKTNAEARADGVKSMLKVLACISLFFDGKDKELNDYLRHLSTEGARP